MKILAMISTVIFLGLLSFNNMKEENIIEEEFNIFSKKYFKTFNSINEKEFRKRIFLKSQLWVKKINSKKLSYNLEINEYADILIEELAHKINLNQNNYYKNLSDDKKIKNNFNYIEKFSWEEHNPNVIVNYRKADKCFGYYAYSVLDAIESRFYLDTGYKIAFSSQQLIDCVTDDYGVFYGCNGGSFIHSWKYLYYNSLYQESEYSYKGRPGTCINYNYNKLFSNIHKITYLGNYNYNSTYEKIQILQNMIYYNPVSTYFVFNNEIKLYKSGIYDLSNCYYDEINYSVSLIGFSNKHNYFILKNSLGLNWGEEGLMRVRFDEYKNLNNNQCGIIHDHASYPHINY